MSVGWRWEKPFFISHLFLIFLFSLILSSKKPLHLLSGNELFLCHFPCITSSLLFRMQRCSWEGVSHSVVSDEFKTKTKMKCKALSPSLATMHFRTRRTLSRKDLFHWISLTCSPLFRGKGRCIPYGFYRFLLPNALFVNSSPFSSSLWMIKLRQEVDEKER